MARARVDVHAALLWTPPEGVYQGLTQENVVSQMHHLQTHPSVAMATRTGKLKIYGWYFDIAGAVVTSYDEERGEFGPLDRGLETVPDAVRESEPAIAYGVVHGHE